MLTRQANFRGKEYKAGDRTKPGLAFMSLRLLVGGRNSYRAKPGSRIFCASYLLLVHSY